MTAKNVLELSDDEQLETTRIYDPNSGRVLNVCAQAGGEAAGTCELANLSTIFDSNGNLMERDDLTVPGGGTSEFSCYDGLNRLQETGFYGPGAAAGTQGNLCSGGVVSQQNYDLAGDITFKTGRGNVNWAH